MAFIGRRQGLVGNELTSLGLRKTFANRVLGRVINRKLRRIRSSHREYQCGERILLVLRQLPHFRNGLFEQLCHIFNIATPRTIRHRHPAHTPDAVTAREPWGNSPTCPWIRPLACRVLDDRSAGAATSGTILAPIMPSGGASKSTRRVATAVPNGIPR